MWLHDTPEGTVVPFRPGPTVRLYACGITPYEATHLGHASTYVTFDVLQRRLLDLGHEVRYVRNITDVGDDMFSEARLRGVHHLDLAFGVVRRFDEDMEALGNLAPWAEPRASGAIPAIRRFVHELMEGGWAYRSGGAVFFDTTRAEGLGRLSGLTPEALAGLWAERGEKPEDPRKRNPLDPILWQPSAVDEPAWDAPWGRGRPGWHVECAAMAVSHLGPTIDIHGGGEDLIHPHHECSSAQATAVTGRPLASRWMHQAVLLHGGHKMSGSQGNQVLVSDLFAGHDPMAVRLALLAHHYRSSWEWDPGVLEIASERLDHWRSAPAGTGAEGVLEEVRASLDSDLDTPAALAAVDEAAASGRRIGAAASLLGVRLAAGGPVPNRSGSATPDR